MSTLKVYEKDLTAATVQAALSTNGLGFLLYCKSAKLHQVVNGDWSLKLEYPTDAPGAELLEKERLICYDGQLYRITRRKPKASRTGRVLTIEAPHVAYDLKYRTIVNIETKEDDRYPDGITAQQALTQLLEGTGFSCGEVTVDASTLDYLDILQKNVMDCIKNQLLTSWGGELEFDNFTLHLRGALGTDRRYPLRDERNLEEITITEDMDKVVTRLHVRGYDGANFEEIWGGRDYIDSPNLSKYAHIYEGYADFSDDDDPAELLRKGLLEIGKHDVPATTYDIRLAELRGSVQYEAYRLMEGFALGDTAVLHTKELDADVILRLTEREVDCLTDRNTSVKLGNTDVELMSAITAGASAADKLTSVLTPDGFLAAEKVSGVLDLVRVTNLKAAVADIAKALIGEATIGTAQIENLSAAVAQIVTANIGTMEVQWADIASLTAAVAKVAYEQVGKADIDFAQIKDLIAGTSIITKGEAGKLFIADLAVTEANMVSLTVGELLVKGQDGAFYAVSVDADGQIVTQKKEIVGGDVADATLGGGKLIESSITTRELNVAQIFADEAVIRSLTASEILTATLKTNILTAGSITAPMIDAGVGAALDLSSNKAIRLLTKSMETTITGVNTYYAASASATDAPLTGWDLTLPENTDGLFVWQKTVTVDQAGTRTESTAVCVSGKDGESATTVRIDSSRGTVFKNNAVSTVLSAVVYHGSKRIADAAGLRAVFGGSARLEWSWQRMSENRFGVILASDSRIGEDGFTLTISPADVDVKTVFMCNLVDG